jgi:hypothetical protein
MLKRFSNFVKYGNSRWVILIIVILLILWALMSYSNSKKSVVDGYDVPASKEAKSVAPSSAPADAHAVSESKPSAVTAASGYALQPVANPADLLPKDANSQWATLNPVNAQAGAPMPDLLQAGYHIGLDTIGQTLKNANYQLRSDPIIAKKDVGPWNQSTYEADYGRVPLEIGAGQP